MIIKRLKDFDIQQISNSGQCFRLEKAEENRFQLVAKDKYLEIEQKAEEVQFFCSEEEFEEIWKVYFDLETNYGRIKESIEEEDEYLKKAILCGGGIRILRQDLWEMIVSFLISQQNNIPRIKKIIRTLCEKYGERRRNFRGKEYFCFPKSEVIAQLEEKELINCNLGYRSKYVMHTAKCIADGSFSIQNLWEMDYKKAKESLKQLYGVGEKVADCICLFGLHQIEAFPIDTHIKQMLEKHYKKGFPFKKYQGYAGVLQQYAFYYETYGERKD